jgi:probable HAF family extracellular repeat protein
LAGAFHFIFSFAWHVGRGDWLRRYRGWTNSTTNKAGLGFLWANGTYSTISVPGAVYTKALGINDSGAVVGTYWDGRRLNGFRDVGGTFTTLNVPGSSNTQATGINDVGQVVGLYINGTGTHGFVYTGGAYDNVDFPSSENTLPQGINDRGAIVGYYGSNLGTEGFFENNGVYEPIVVPSSDSTFAQGINESDQVVGYFFSPTAAPQAFIGVSPFGVPGPELGAGIPGLSLLLGIVAFAAWRWGFGPLSQADDDERLAGSAAAYFIHD